MGTYVGVGCDLSVFKSVFGQLTGSSRSDKSTQLLQLRSREQSAGHSRTVTITRIVAADNARAGGQSALRLSTTAVWTKWKQSASAWAITFDAHADVHQRLGALAANWRYHQSQSGVDLSRSEGSC